MVNESPVWAQLLQALPLTRWSPVCLFVSQCNQGETILLYFLYFPTSLFLIKYFQLLSSEEYLLDARGLNLYAWDKSTGIFSDLKLHS